MGIEKIGLNVVSWVEPKPRNLDQKFMQIAERRRDYNRMINELEKRTAEYSVKADSARITDMNKINAQGYRDSAPEVKYTRGAVWENVNYYKAQSSGYYFDKYA